ncbi:unnamed protein product [Penicillium salamii]|nr:unnamed protein product [Penicillium salamii]CAG8222335.1 unnamed protein product [Penicillium salamii]
MDLDSVWREFPNIPTSPSCFAANYWTSCLVQHNTMPMYARCGKWPPFVECLFHRRYESECSFSWTGPDPLSPDTCADDLFLYVSAFFLLERVNWIEIRLSKLSITNKEVVEEHPFFLPRVASMLGNLPRILVRFMISYCIVIMWNMLEKPDFNCRCGHGLRTHRTLLCGLRSLYLTSTLPFMYLHLIRSLLCKIL